MQNEPISPDLPTASLLSRLRAGSPVLSLGIRAARTPEIARWAKAAGYDALWVDLEHSGISVEAASQICATALDLGLVPWARVPEDDFGMIGRLLDGGALGIIAPRVESVAQARRYVTACRFAPRGQRSQIATLPQVGYRTLPATNMNAFVDAAMTVQILLESARGIAVADEIAALPGVDILAVGANDLSADLGHAGDPTAPAVIAACEAVVRAAARHGKLAVIGGLGDPAALAALQALGAAPLVFAGIDSDLFLRALMHRAAQARATHLRPAA